MSSIKLGNRIIYVGMKVKATTEADRQGLAPEGLIPYIDKIRVQPPEPQILLYSGGDRVEGYSWHDEEGNYDSRTCFWVNASQLQECFALPESDVVIKGKVVHKGRSLMGMKGKILAGDSYKRRARHYFIELEEDVGGCSADGLGKSGHCVVVNVSDIKFESAKFKKVGDKQ